MSLGDFRNTKARIFFFALMVFGLTSCGEDDEVVSPSPVVFQSLTEVSYNTTTAKLRATGSLQIPGATELTVIDFHRNASCSDASAGQGIARDFSATGILIEVPSTLSSQLYVRTNIVDECYFFTSYDPLHAPPPPASFSKFLPASPSRISTTPAIYGSTSASTVQIYFYDDSQCTHAVGQGTPNDFSTIGIQLSLQSNQTSTIFQKTIEPFGNPSACAWIANYVHDTTAPAAPIYSGTLPISPANSTNEPKIRGILSSDSAGIMIFSDAACATAIGNGSKADFEAQGVPALVSSDTATTLYAKALDASGNASTCAYLTTYVHDAIAPEAPGYVTITPASPTRLTIFPKVQGTSSADTVGVALFNNVNCSVQIGYGTKVQFEGVGISVNATPNALTRIFARSIDAAGNASSCVYMTEFENDSIAPELPIFNTTTPVSPNNLSITPLVLGGTSSDTVSINLYKDETCTQLIGSGTAEAFLSPGIQVTVPENTITMIYAISYDLVGNASDCTLMTNYAHSTVPAEPPVFVRTYPASPSNTSVKPGVQGTLAADIISVQLFNDPGCTTQIGTGRRVDFLGLGAQATVAPNASTDIYAYTTNIYGNISACTFMTSYIHDNTVPSSPVFSLTTPASPNKISTSPVVTGTAPNDAVTVSLYDNSICVNRIGTGTRADFVDSGIVANVAANNTTTIYARTFDAATNGSACTLLTTYIHDDIAPANPSFVSATPRTPSYTQETLIKGTSSSDTDTVTLYSDPACATSIITQPKFVFDITGIPVTATENATTTVYAKSFDVVGNASQCRLMVNYVHSNLGPQNPSTMVGANGAVNFSWNSDPNAASYLVKRSVWSGGPYTVVNSGSLSNFYTDRSVSNNSTYYYVVSASNVTGTSKNSAEVQATVSVLQPARPTGLTAIPGPNLIRLNWSGSNTAMSYTVYRSIKRGGPYTPLATNVTALTYADNTASNNNGYYYVVAALNPWGYSAVSDEASAVPKTVPAPPTGLIATPVAGGIQLSWSAPSYFNEFRVKRGVTSGTEVQIANTSSTTYLDTAPDTADPFNNYYVVTAVWDQEESASSNEVAIKNTPGPSVTPKAGDGVVSVTWSDMLATNYKILRATKPGGPYTVLSAAYSGVNYPDNAVVNGTTYYYVVIANYEGIPGLPSAEVDATPAVNPSAPSNLILTVVSGKPVLNWIAPTHYRNFNVKRASSLAGPYNSLGYSANNTYTDAIPLVGVNYYQVTAVWGTQETAATNIVSFRHGVPTGVTATPAANQVVLTWSNVTGASNYKILRATASGGPYTTLSSTAATPYTDSTVVAGTGYFYVVSANFPDGTVGQPSTEVSATPGATTIPKGLTVTATTTSTVTLTWAKVTNATNYKVYRATVSGGPYTYTGAPFANPTATVPGLSMNTNYFFTVTSIVGGIESSKSTEVGARTSYMPAAPQTTPGNNSVTVNWSFDTAATSYTLERTSDGVNFSTWSGITAATYTDDTAVNGNLYFYRYRPIYNGVASFYSPLSRGVTPGVIPLVPGGLMVTANNTGTEITLACGVVPGATGYKIKQSLVSGGPYTTAVTSSGAVNTITGLTAGTPYYFVVSALTGTMESGDSVQLAVVPSTPPAAPTAVADLAGNVTISWSAIPGAVAYDVERSNDTINFTRIATYIAGTTHTETSVTAGLPYIYRYLPYFDVGTAMAYSSVSSTVYPGVRPLTPSALIAVANGTTSATLAWINVPSAVSYNVKRGTSAGGPYPDIFSTTASTLTDTGLTPGTTYYYIVTAVNASGLESTNSNEASVSLVAAPVGLTATAVNNAINLSWSAVDGATSYVVRRGTTSGGPYGQLAAAAAGTTFADTDIENGVAYDYVVAANFASGAVSPDSNEATATALATMNLQVPIELTDQALGSDTSAVTFERTRTSLDPSAYDGALTYSFEITASNTDSVPYDVLVIDSAGSTVATATVPALTTSPTRLRVGLVPSAGWDTYRVKLPATAAYGQLRVLSARILIDQIGATQTKLYIPLLSSNAAPSSADAIAALEATSASTYAALNSATIYRRNTAVFSSLDSYNAWELETVVATTPDTIGAVALYNTSTNNVVEDTETLFSSDTLTLTSSPFSEGTAGFGTANENQDFQVAISCVDECSSGSVKIYKAGLWVTLTQLDSAEVFFRNSLSSSVPPAGIYSDWRSLIDLSVFTNPTVFFQGVASLTGLTSLEAQLYTDGTNDSGLNVGTPVASGTLTFSGNTKTWNRSAGLTINSGERFLTGVSITGDAGRLHDSTIVVRVVR